MSTSSDKSLFVEFSFGMWHAGLLGSLMYDLVETAEWPSGLQWFLTSEAGWRWWAKVLVGCVFICEWCFVRSETAKSAIRSVSKERTKCVRYFAAVIGLVTPLLLVIGVKYAGDEANHSVTDAALFFTALAYFVFQFFVSHLSTRNVIALLLSLTAPLALGEAWQLSKVISSGPSYYVCPIIALVVFAILFWLMSLNDPGDDNELDERAASTTSAEDSADTA